MEVDVNKIIQNLAARITELTIENALLKTENETLKEPAKEESA